MRHFRVKDSSKKLLNSKEFNEWVEDYDRFDLEGLDVKIDKNIEVFITSQKRRAILTAEKLKLKSIESNLFNEVETEAFIDTKIKLSKTLWLFIARVLWYFNLTKLETRNDSIKRAKDAIEFLKSLKKESCLIVSHGFFMKILIKELEKSSYKGEIDVKPKNGKTYLFSSK